MLECYAVETPPLQLSGVSATAAYKAYTASQSEHSHFSICYLNVFDLCVCVCAMSFQIQFQIYTSGSVLHIEQFPSSGDSHVRRQGFLAPSVPTAAQF